MLSRRDSKGRSVADSGEHSTERAVAATKELTDTANELRSLTLTALSVAAYIGVTAAATRDCDLVSGEGTTHLPLVDANVPLMNAMVALPLALLLFFIYVYENLERLRRRASEPIGVWPLSECVHRKFGHGVSLAVLTQGLVWGAWPLVSGILAWRIAPLRWHQSLIQYLFFAVAVVISMRYWLVTTKGRSGPVATAVAVGCLALLGTVFAARHFVGGRARAVRPLKDFASAHLVGLRLGPLDVADDANFNGADLAGVDLSHVQLVAATFARAHLERTVFSDIDTHPVDLTHVDFTDASAARAVLGNCSLTLLAGADLSGANLWNAALVNAHLDDAILKRANLGGVREIARRSLFDNVTADGANFFKAFIPQASFAFASLKGANFTAANLCRANFANATLTRARFAGADLRGANFGGANLEAVDFGDACLKNAKFDGLTRFPRKGFEPLAREMVRGDDTRTPAPEACPELPKTPDAPLPSTTPCQ